MKKNLKKIFLIPFVLVLICLVISFLEYKQITHINPYDARLVEKSPMCGTFEEAKSNSLHQCKSFFEFMTHTPSPLDLVLIIAIFVVTAVPLLFIFLFKKNKKYFYFAFLMLILVFLVLSLIYTNSNDANALFMTGELK